MSLSLEAPKLTFVRRKNLCGRKCVAPFIGKYNIWDIPEEYWSIEVERAILRAYELGAHQTLQVIGKTELPRFGTNARFSERAER